MTRALVLIAVIGAVLALPAHAQAPRLTGFVGPGYTIGMKKPTKAGKATLVVNDRSSSHNFRLRGPGVSVSTSVRARGSRTFTVTFKKGRYTFVCDPHADSMRGSFRIP
jgi:hypothetical protein